jgi:hypothetical protein
MKVCNIREEVSDHEGNLQENPIPVATRLQEEYTFKNSLPLLRRQCAQTPRVRQFEIVVMGDRASRNAQRAALTDEGTR